MTLAASPSAAEARYHGCDLAYAPVLCQIHHWVGVTNHARSVVGAAPIRYGWSAERSTSAAYREWVRHRWHTRAVMWLKRSRLDPAGVIHYVWGPAVGTATAGFAVTVARCESGLRPDAYNPSGATGVFQIIGGPFDVWDNVRMALRMYHERGWQPWVASAYCWS